VVTLQPEDPYLDGVLDYLAEPPEPPVHDLPTLRDVWLGAQRLVIGLAEPSGGLETTSRRATFGSPAAGSEPPSWLKSGLSARFFRLVALPGESVAAPLAEWWTAGARDGVITVARRLRLGPPRGDPGTGWTMDGWIRRLTRWHWVPVVVELWPLHGNWMMTMTPQAHVVASKRYFRTGHLVLDRLTTELAGPAAAQRHPVTGASCHGVMSRPG
jgi:hypothetical protein